MSCNKNFRRVKTINITIFGDVLLLTIPAGNYFDDQRVEICTCQVLPCDITSDVVVHIQLGDAGPQFPLTACGHDVYGDQIRSRRCYCTRVATDTGVFAYAGGAPLCCSQHVNPPVLVAPPPVADQPVNADATVLRKAKDKDQV